ncbi:MAG: ATP-grasp domain-containing protein [Oscillospiraceae bacterium]|jgi:predicted ATP-grasp superfamily ATP-dependent carboligase|nr:ATP-grasp domain-containing protein [Oscillospiraceae bacterium]
MTRNVIVTDTKYRAAASVIRELGRADYRVIAAFDDAGLPVSARSKYVAERVKIVGNYADRLLSLARELDAVIFPCGARTTAIMAERREEFSPHTLISNNYILQKANDKQAVAQAAREIGLRVPSELNIANADDFSYPVIIKYVNGEGLGKTAAERYANAQDRAEFDAAMAIMSKYPSFVSEYVAGSGFGVSVLMDRNHRAVRVFCHERLREYPLSGGPSVMCRSVWCGSMARDAVKLLRALDFEGLAMVEFKGSPDDYALLEINPRVWGSYPLSYLADAKFAEGFVRAAVGEMLPEVTEPQYKTGVCMQYFLSGARWALATKSPLNMLKFAAETVNPRVKHGLWSWSDPKPGLAYLKNAMRSFNEN